jgi:hypothetical protein
MTNIKNEWTNNLLVFLYTLLQVPFLFIFWYMNARRTS